MDRVKTYIDQLKVGFWQRRQEACRALGMIGDTRAVEPLIQKLEDEDSGVRQEACRALGAIGNEGAVEPLLRMLGDVDKKVREAACEALGKLDAELDAKEVAKIISGLLQQDPDEDALRKVRQQLSEGNTRIQEALLGMLADERCSRDSARHALGKLGDKGAV